MRTENKKVIVSVIFLMAILLIPMASAEVFSFDNRLDYSEDKLTVEIINTLDLIGDNTLGTIELKSHSSVDEIKQVGYGDYQAVMYYDFSGWELYENGLGNVYFTDMRTGEEVDKLYYFAKWDKIKRDLPIYNDTILYSKNGSIYTNQEILGYYEDESVEGWVEMSGNDIPESTNANVRIALMVYVEKGDKTDGVWTIAGKRIKEHAGWTPALEVDINSWWTYDAKLGIDQPDDFFAVYNGTNNGAANFTGILGSSYNYVAAEGDWVDYGTYANMENSWSISIWLFASSPSANSYPMAKDNGNILQTSSNNLYFASDVSVLIPLSASTWTHVVLTYEEGVGVKMYKDGVLTDSSGWGGFTGDSTNFQVGDRADLTKPYNGLLDEIGIWNRTLSLTEVQDLFNGSDTDGPIQPEPSPSDLPPVVFQITPVNNFNSSTSSVTFIGNATDDFTLVNVSILIDGSIEETNTSGIQGNYTFSRALTNGLHNWSILAFDNNSQSTETANRSVNITVLSPTITLFEPVDNLQTIETLINFTGAVTDDFDIVNVSFFLNSVLNETNSSGLKDVNYSFNKSLVQGDYTWFYRAFDNDSNPTDSSTRSLTVHLTNPDIVIIEPSGVIGSFVLGDDLDLNWSIQEIGVNLSAHISNCSFGYNGVITYLNITTCVETNFTTFLYVDGVNNLNFTVVDIFNLSSTNTTSWSFAFLEGNTSFEGNVSETSRQEFEINLTTDINVLAISAVLTYNGTNHTSTASCDGGNCTVSNTIDVPLVINGDEFSLFDFFWQLSIFNGTTSTQVTTSTREQNVTRIHLEECAGDFNTTALNFTTYDEQNLTRINPFLFDATFNQWLGSGTVKRESNFTNSSIDEFNICIAPNSTYFIDAIIDYDEGVNTTNIYTLRNYFFQNDTISNVSQDIFMYLLPSSASTSFILKVQDDALLPVSSVLVETLRYYPGTNEFRIVQIGRTDDDGKSIGFFETETVDYKFNITQYNSVLLETGIQKVFPETSPYTLTFNLGDPLGEPWSGQEELEELNSTLTWNDTSGFVTYIYIDSSGNFSKATLLVMEDSLTNISADTIICNVTSSLTSATLTCNVGSSDGFYTASGIINRDAGDQLDKQIAFQIETLSGIVGTLGLFFGWFLILISAFMFKFNDIAGIWGIAITVFLVNLTGLIKFGNVFAIGLIGVAIILTWVIEGR